MGQVDLLSIARETSWCIKNYGLGRKGTRERSDGKKDDRSN